MVRAQVCHHRSRNRAHRRIRAHNKQWQTIYGLHRHNSNFSTMTATPFEMHKDSEVIGAFWRYIESDWSNMSIFNLIGSRVFFVLKLPGATRAQHPVGACRFLKFECRLLKFEWVLFLLAAVLAAFMTSKTTCAGAKSSVR